ncbi:MAG: 50S ribosomal protein L29 [Verrucomicrobia bacterium]|jgi:large subunit ribosomal protein L29|nr:MAG: 50S ribosomal protein L29 [Verrucomicrobiota bacterium]MDH4470394.1 50S ribosomal protein L29 [Verrucomicrobiae bacterium]
MTNSEIKELTPNELSARIAGHREEIFHFRLQQQAGQLEKPHLLRIARREIARLQTFLTLKTK